MSTHVVLPVSANENKLRQKKISLHYGYTKSQVLTTFLLTKKIVYRMEDTSQSLIL
jgi:hypothetical protein